jgi:hypothetical protein
MICKTKPIKTIKARCDDVRGFVTNPNKPPPK